MRWHTQYGRYNVLNDAWRTSTKTGVSDDHNMRHRQPAAEEPTSSRPALASYEPSGHPSKYDHSIYLKHQEVDKKLKELHRCELSIKLKMFLLGMPPYAKCPPSDVMGWLDAFENPRDDDV